MLKQGTLIGIKRIAVSAKNKEVIKKIQISKKRRSNMKMKELEDMELHYHYVASSYIEIFFSS